MNCHPNYCKFQQIRVPSPFFSYFSILDQKNGGIGLQDMQYPHHSDRNKGAGVGEEGGGDKGLRGVGEGKA